MAKEKPKLGKELLAFWRSIVFLLTPLVLCPLPIAFAKTEDYKIANCAYAVIIMAVYWTTEVLPLSVTALLPIVLFPMLGVQSSKNVCINYLKDSNFLFVGGLLVAVAIERWNLHKRIALRVLLTVGSEPRWIMLGMMSATAFLSMWISNTATTAMMVPIAQAILLELLKERGLENPEEKSTENGGSVKLKEMKMEEGNHRYVEDDATAGEKQVQPITFGRSGSASQADKMGKGLLLCICYAANIGGTATLTGTPPNLVIVQTVDALFPDGPGIDFATWFAWGFPAMILALLLAWAWLQLMFLDCRCLLGCRNGGCCKREKDNAVHGVIRKQYDELGPMSFAEKVVLFHFVLLVLLWFFRDMKFVHLKNGRAAGWTYFFESGYVTDASTGILISIVLFFWPSQPPNFMCLRRDGDTRPAKPAPPILDWPTVHQKMPWSVVILLGGGFALADGVKASGLSDWMGEGFRSLQGFNVVALALIISIIVAFITEFTSNTSTAAIFLPVLGNLAEGICIHPYYLMIPATIACSFAFMLPVATPPNAIVFSYGRIKVFDMAKCGFMLNLGCILVLTFAINTYGVPLYSLDTFPSWATCASDVTTLPMNTTMLSTTATTLAANATMLLTNTTV